MNKVYLNINNKIVDNYLIKMSAKSFSDLELLPAKKLFITIIKDYRKGKISIDYLGYFGSKLFHSVAKNYPKDKLFFRATISAMDLPFAVRHGYGNFEVLMKDVDAFYNMQTGK